MKARIERQFDREHLFAYPLRDDERELFRKEITIRNQWFAEINLQTLEIMCG